MDKVAEELGGIRQALEKQNEIMLERLPKQSGKFVSSLEIVVLIAGALGFIHIADTLRQWLTGG